MHRRGVLRIARPLFLVAGVSFVFPVLDALVRAAPFQLGNPSWRLALSLSVVQSSVIPLLGLALAALVAASLERHRMLGLIAVGSAVLGAILFWAFLELVGDQRNLESAQLLLPAARAIVSVVACGWIARAGMRGLRWQPAARQQGRVMEVGPSVVSTSVAEWIPDQHRFRERSVSGRR